MNGPFFVERYCTTVKDDGGEIVASCADEQKAAMVCAALNAVYYAAKATGSAQ